MSDLFRREAVAHATRRLAGDVVLASSVSSRVLAILFIVVVAAGVLFAATASYARKETVSGWLTPAAGLIRLTASEGGVVERLLVAEGDRVTTGQPVAILRSSQTLQAGDSFSSLSASIATQQDAARAQAETRREALLAEQTQLAQRRSGLADELGQARRRLELQSERLELSRAEVARAEAIAAQGFLPGRELEARRSAALAAEQTLSEITGQVLSHERQIREVESRLAVIPIDLRAVEAEGVGARAALAQHKTETEARSTYVVIATVDGRVAALPAQLGQSLAAGGTIGIVTSGDGPLEAELYAPSRAAGFVREGQEVRLMYQAFPHQKFGSGEGRIVSVSRTVLGPRDIAIEGLRVDEPVFRVRVRLDRADVSAYGRDIPLQPGMLLTADIIVDRRSLLEWLLDPLYAAGRRG